MDRLINYPGQIPLDTDLLTTNRSTMIALGKLIAAVLGTGNVINGLTVAPNSPAALNVVVSPGEIYSLQNVDGTAYSSLPADTAHTCVKQGISLDPVILACAAPSTAGQSINYLIEATFQEVDSAQVVLPYYNASNPSQAFSGPNNSGTAQSTLRQGKVTVQAKAGVSATTGSQVTPTVDAGFVALAVVTVANGQTTITSGNISALGSGAVLSQSILATVQGLAAPVVGTTRLARMSVTAASATATLTAAEVVVETSAGQPFRLSAFNQSINLGTVGAGGMDVSLAPTSGYVAVYAIYNPTTGSAALLAKDATSSVQPDVYGGANMPSGYTASALVAVWPTNSSKQFIPGYQVDRKFFFPYAQVLNTSTQQSALTSLNVSSSVPPNAKTCRGFSFLTTNAGVNSTMAVSGSAAAPVNGIGMQQMVGYNGTGVAFTQMPFTDVPLITPQVIFYAAHVDGGAMNSAQLFLSAYEF